MVTQDETNCKRLGIGEVLPRADLRQLRTCKVSRRRWRGENIIQKRMAQIDSLLQDWLRMVVVGSS
jgi:hypothetical protein